MRLIGYIRVSTDEQGNSIEDQRPALERYCELFNHDLVGIVIDKDVSGGVELNRRQGGCELMSRLSAAEADGFVITEIDRAFRLAVDGLAMADWFEKRGLQIHTVFDQVNTSNPDGWMMFAMRVVSADWERRKIGYRTKRALTGLRTRGRSYSGTAPYGTVHIVEGKDDEGNDIKVLYRDPATWAVRDRIVSLKRDGSTVTDIIVQLAREGVPAPGGKGKDGKATGGKRWHRSTIRRILETHDDLKHIPPLDGAPEASVSEKGAA